MHGFGTETWPGGARYSGNYSEGLKQGSGAYYWADGTEYVGEWRENEINGHGSIK